MSVGVRDLLEPIAPRFAELQTELGRMGAELDAARSRLASYEEFERGLREAAAAALLKAQEELRPRLAALRDELSHLEAERDGVRGEVARLREERTALEAALAALRTTSSELRNESAETLRSLFQQVLGEMREELVALAASVAADPLSTPEPAATARPVAPEPSARPVDYAIVEPEVPAAMSPAAPVPAAVIEDVESLAPAVEPLPPTETPLSVRLATPPPGRVEVVLHDVRSSPQLLAIESRIQSLPGVSRVYAQRTGDGLATLTVHLDPAMNRDQFVATLARNDWAQLVIESVNGDVVRARITQ